MNALGNVRDGDGKMGKVRHSLEKKPATSVVR